MDTLTRVGIVGSGQMGGGIAEVAARAGFDVVLRSRTPQAAATPRWRRSTSRWPSRSPRASLEAAEREAILARITPTDDLDDLVDCDLVIESVVEDLAVKKALFAELDAVCKPDAILATNTSTLSVIELAVQTKRPERVCGIHFFNPAPLMSLVEVVRPLTASDETIAAAKAFAVACGKDAVDVKDRAGFIVNALLFPYLNNAVRMLDHGTASMEDIDTAMKGGCNFPLGPFQLLDLVGLDTSVSILDALYAEFKDPNYTPVPRLRRMVEAGLLGRKSRPRVLRLPGVTPGRSSRRRRRGSFPDAHRRTRRPGVRRRRPRAGHDAGRLPGRAVPDAVRPAPPGLVVAGSPRRAAARRAAGHPVAAPLGAPVRGPGRHRRSPAVMTACAAPHRRGGWITPAFVRAYSRLHELGWAHSVEAWTRRRRAGRRALRRGDRRPVRRRVDVPPATRRLQGRARGPGRPAAGRRVVLLDVQWVTPHLASLGAREITRRDYLTRLRAALAAPASF